MVCVFERKIGNKGAVRDDDQFALLQLADEFGEVLIALDADDLVHETERAVEPLGVAVGNR